MTTIPHKVCTQCGVSRTLRHYVSPRGRVCDICQKARTKTASRNRHVDKHYELTPEEYAKLVAHQGGKCHMCAEPRREGYAWHVDHSHGVERAKGTRASIRGLICARCNTLLRKVRDNPRVFLGGYHYLVSWPSADVFAFVQGSEVVAG